MADLTINVVAVRTPPGVTPVSRITTVNVNAGATVYAINTTHVALANANVNANVAATFGFTVANAYVGQHVPIATSGVMDLGATIPTGHVLVQSPNGGMVGNHGDLSTNHFLTVLGYGNNSSTVQIDITATGLQRA